MPRRGGGRRKKRRTHVREDLTLENAKAGAQKTLQELHYKKKEEDKEVQAPKTTLKKSKDVPKSFVVRHGKVGKNLQLLVTEFRKLMLPYTAINLRERNNSSMKDYVAVAGPLSVSHIVAISKSTKGPLLRIGRMPEGPTLTFRICRYALGKHIREKQRRIVDPTKGFQYPPLVVLNNFEEGNKRHIKICALTFQAMFPAINVQTVKLNQCKRVLLLHYIPDEDTIEMRHYTIRTKPKGVSKKLKPLLRSKIPNLKNAKDISEVVLGDIVTGYATSDSEFEEENVVTISDPQTRNRTSSQNSIRLSEIGPRLSLQLIKVEEGIFSGEVQYHKFQKKSKQEILKLRKKHEEAAELKKQRRETQEANVKRKREEAERKKKEKEEKRAKFEA
mmetsp:Transcript_13437/g.15338  ORF Transcript_13437/g.15338 Transcript_13437/m.15338 type:complete len:389 (+) Transcript_13437:79-1245(+)